jgi:hypothetical protein
MNDDAECLASRQLSCPPDYEVFCTTGEIARLDREWVEGIEELAEFVQPKLVSGADLKVNNCLGHWSSPLDCPYSREAIP